MDTEKEFSCLEKVCRIYSKTIDAEGEYQETLPAYLDDIYRVVRCTAHSYITSADISFNEVKIYGKTEIQITYYNENSVMCYADFDEEFSKAVTVDNLSENAFVRAQICDRYTNFRVINQRRIDIHTMASIIVSVYDTVKYPSLSSCDNSKLKEETVVSADVIATYVDRIEFDEELALPSDSMPIGRIISITGYPVASEIKVIKDKALIKAELKLTLLYTADSDNGEIEKAEYSIEMSKIIERSGIDDGDVVIPDISLGSIYAKVKGGAGDKMSTVNVFGDVAVNLTFLREREVTFNSDGYVIGAQSKCDYSEFTVCTEGKLIAENKLVSVPLEFNSEITDVKDLSVKLDTPLYNNGTIQLKVEALALTEKDGGLTTLAASADIEIPAENYDDAIVSVTIGGYDYTLSGSGRVDLRLNLAVTAYFYNEKSNNVLSDITAGEAVNNNHTMTVYFARNNERVWDIAKRFSSDESEIISENQLKSDTLDAAQILIIPRA